METLREMLQDYKTVYEMDTDIDVDTWFDTLEAIQGSIEVKADNWITIMSEYTATAEKFKAEAERMADKQRIYENRVKRMKERLFQIMNESGIKEIPNEFYTIKIQGNGGAQPLKYVEGREIPMEYKKAVYEPDTAKIREALKAGKLDFAYLGERGTHLVIK